MEDAVAASLTKRGVPVLYETERVQYEVPAKFHWYTPDFKINRKDGTYFYVETKGYWDAADRKKHKLIREVRPDVDVRFVFQKPNTPICKGSKTTYAKYAEKLGIKWAVRDIPDEWLKE